MKETKLLLPLEKLYKYEKECPEKIAFRQPLNGVWHEMNWRTVGQKVRTMAQALKNMSFPEKSKIAILSKNCDHWIISDLAIWMAGHISIPLYPTLGTSSINEILKHSESQLVFVGKLDDWDKQRDGLKNDIPRIHFPQWTNVECTSWDDFTKDVAPMKEEAARELEDICTIIYTSGTTGTAKGVVHSFRTFSSPVNSAIEILEFSSKDKFFSYLPLAHVAERLLVEMGGLYSGGTISFAESLDTFAKNLAETQPTIFLAVPRIWTKFQQGILAKMPQEKLDKLLRIPILSGIIKKKIKTKLGLRDTRLVLTGAAPISKNLMTWWKNLGFEIQEAYGMTENFCYGTFSHKGRVKLDSVGESWPDSETKIGENGEILLRSAANMIGYYKDSVQTAEVLDADGWLHTGDLGELDSDGYLKITGRVKELFKTSKGKYVAPTPIEKQFSSCTLIEQVCIVGAGMPQPLALIVLSELAASVSKEDIHSEIYQLMKTINNNVESYERLNGIVVLEDEWSTDSGILTPTLKIKRNVVEKKYAPHFEKWSELRGQVHFF